MIVNDTEAILRKQLIAHREASIEGRAKSLAAEVKDHVHTERMTNEQARLGRPLMPIDLEQRLSRLNSDLVYEVIEANPTHKRLSVMRNGEKVFVAVYENSLMPERSIMRSRVVEVPDPKVTHIDRADMPKHEGDLRPGWRRIEIPGGEKVRGWRAVLVRLIQQGIISLTQAEDAFGADNTPEWAQHTGKGAYTTPF